MSNCVVDPTALIDVHEVTSASVEAVIRAVEASHEPDHFVNRESELDVLWSLADMAMREGGTNAEDPNLLELLWQAHDFIGDGRKDEAVQTLARIVAILR